MDKTITLTELLTYSEQLPLETYQWFSHPYLSPLATALLFVGLISLFYFIRKANSSEAPIYIGFLIMGLTFSLTSYVAADSKLTTDSAVLYEQEERRWEREMVPAFIQQLTREVKTDIREISYSEELVEAEKYEENPIRRDPDVFPVKVVLDDGNEYELWAKVTSLQEGMTDSQLEFKYLEKDLVFHERSEVLKEKGYFDVTLYTDKDIE